MRSLGRCEGRAGRPTSCVRACLPGKVRLAQGFESAARTFYWRVKHGRHSTALQIGQNLSPMNISLGARPPPHKSAKSDAVGLLARRNLNAGKTHRRKCTFFSFLGRLFGPLRFPARFPFPARTDAIRALDRGCWLLVSSGR